MSIPKKYEIFIGYNKKTIYCIYLHNKKNNSNKRFKIFENRYNKKDSQVYLFDAIIFSEYL